MKHSRIIYYPNKTIHENAIINGVTDDGIRYHIKTNHIDRRLESKLIIINDIKKYLKKHPTATKEKISKATKHSVSTIRRYIRIVQGEEQVEMNFGSQKTFSDISKDNVIRSIGKNQNQILFDILKLYIPSGKYDCDLTYSQGMFYKDIQPPAYKFDKYPLADDVKPLDEAYSLDSCSLMSVVIDLPFIIKANEKDAARARMVGRFQCFFSVQELMETNKNMLTLAYRLLKKGGILVQKVQNTIFAGKQVWTSYITQHQAQELGFEMVDEFILEGRSRWLYYQDTQLHARKYHSYFFVFKKK